MCFCFAPKLPEANRDEASLDAEYTRKLRRDEAGLVQNKKRYTIFNEKTHAEAWVF